jgi:hypothetical protein
MNITLDIKTLITITGIVALLGGFYYSTNHRLSHLEGQLVEVTKGQDELSGQLRQIQKQLKRLK